MSMYSIQTRTGEQQGWPPITISGESKGNAKYLAYLELSDCYETFAHFLRDIESVRKTSRFERCEATVQFKKGDIVRMANCAEAEFNQGKTFKVLSEPTRIGGTLCVWLEGYRGCFACNCLQMVKSSDSSATWKTALLQNANTLRTLCLM